MKSRDDYMEIAVALRICAANSECPDNCPRRLYPYSSTCASRLKNDAADAITDLLNRPPVEGLSSDARLLLLYCPEVINELAKRIGHKLDEAVLNGFKGGDS